METNCCRMCLKPPGDLAVEGYGAQTRPCGYAGRVLDMPSAPCRVTQDIVARENLIETMDILYYIWLVVWNIFYIFHNIWDNPSQLTFNIFQDG